MEPVYRCVSSLRTSLMREFLFSFPQTQCAMLLQNPNPPLLNEEELLHPFLVLIIWMCRWPGFKFDQTTNCCLYFKSHSFKFLYVFITCFNEPEAQTGVHSLLNSLEFAVYLCFMTAYNQSASKFHACGCLCLNTRIVYQLDVINSTDNLLCGQPQLNAKSLLACMF